MVGIRPQHAEWFSAVGDMPGRRRWRDRVPEEVEMSEIGQPGTERSQAEAGEGIAGDGDGREGATAPEDRATRETSRGREVRGGGWS